MTQRIRAAAAADVPSDKGLMVVCGGEQVAIFRIDGAYYACSARCPHAGGPLHEGFIDGTTVTCPWHGWAFELNCAGNAPRDGVDRFKVVAEGDDLYLEMPA